MTWTGGCFCGEVRYQITGEAYNKTTCHCPSCRRATGAPAVSWFTVALDDFRLLLGIPAEFRSSAHVIRTFCDACGTAISYRNDAMPGEIDVTLCSLDHPEAMAPADHTFTGYRLPWNVLGDGLPQYPGLRSEGISGGTARTGSGANPGTPDSQSVAP
ncbi:MAG: GFA family protein [Pseudomonadota bacterium]|nr:GFA family protein [Pseudomonadota bacterium]